MKKFNEEYLNNGLGPTYNKLRMLNYLRFGTLVGTDTNGNKYYEIKDAPHGPVPLGGAATPTGVWAIETSTTLGARFPPPAPPRPHRSPPARPAQISPRVARLAPLPAGQDGARTAEFNQVPHGAHD